MVTEGYAFKYRKFLELMSSVCYFFAYGKHILKYTKTVVLRSIGNFFFCGGQTQLRVSQQVITVNQQIRHAK